jgi:hypothetical protein
MCTILCFLTLLSGLFFHFRFIVYFKFYFRIDIKNTEVRIQNSVLKLFENAEGVPF